MTAIASAGAGNWGTAGTWNPAQVPTAGDTVTITHTITYDVNDDANAIGAITINAGGTLQWAGGVGTKALRLGGIMTLNGGGIIGKDGTFIRILPGYYINVNNVAGSNIDMLGTVPNFQTTLTGIASIGDGYLSVTDETGFGIGDWISVYDKDNIAYTDRDAEGFIVNATASGEVYLRRWVGPQFTLASAIGIGDTAIYSSESVGPWAVGMKFVIGTEVFTISVVDKANRILTTGAAAATHSVGLIAYQTGCEKAHASGDDVYKLATTLVGATSGNSYVDVVNAAGWAAADVLGLGGEWYPGCEEVTIDTISVGGGSGGSDRISITGTLSRTYTATRPIVKLNRDCVIHGASTDVAVYNGGFINDGSWGGEARTLTLYNVELKCVGNNGSIVYGGVVSTCSYSGAGGRKFLNLSSHNAYPSGQCGAIGQYWSNYMSAHNCVLFSVACGSVNDGTYGAAMFCNIYIGGNSSIMWRPTGGYQAEYDYTLTMSCYQWATYIHGWVGAFRGTTDGDPTNGLRNIISISDEYAVYLGTSEPAYAVHKVKIINPRYRVVYFDWNGIGSSVRDWYGEYYGAGAQYEQVSYWLSGYTMNFQNSVTLLTRFGGDPDEAKALYSYGWGERDHTIRQRRAYSWKFTPRVNDGRLIGFGANVLGEPGRSLTVQAWVRKSATSNGAGPYIQFRNNKDTTLASDTISVAHSVWELLTVTYTPTETDVICVLIGGYGDAGNFWIDSPTIDTSGCHYDLGVMAPEWSFGNMNAGVRLVGGRV